VPFRFEHNKILVDVAINDSDPLVFALDTGAPFALFLRPAKVEGIAFDVYGESQIWGAGSQGVRETTQLAQNVRLDLGGLRFEGAAMDLLADSAIELQAMLPFDGIFGGQIFESVVAEIDCESSTMRLYDPAVFEAPSDGSVLPLKRRGGYIYVTSEVTIDGAAYPAEVVVDTGASHALVFRSEVVAAPAKRVSDVKLGRGLSGPIAGDVGRAEQFLLGDLRFENVEAEFPGVSAWGLSAGSDGSVGMEVLRRLVVTFDYPNNRMFLEPTEAMAEPLD
jgi:hypothetical protein